MFLCEVFQQFFCGFSCPQISIRTDQRLDRRAEKGVGVKVWELPRNLLAISKKQLTQRRIKICDLAPLVCNNQHIVAVVESLLLTLRLHRVLTRQHDPTGDVAKSVASGEQVARIDLVARGQSVQVPDGSFARSDSRDDPETDRQDSCRRQARERDSDDFIVEPARLLRRRAPPPRQEWRSRPLAQLESRRSAAPVSAVSARSLCANPSVPSSPTHLR